MRVGLCGLGTVGAEVARRLRDEHDLLQQRCGQDVALHGVAVRDTNKKRDVDLGGVIVGTDPVALASAQSIDVIIEVMGGTDTAANVVRTALENGKSVITANKQLMAAHGTELYEVAAKSGASLHCSAAVGGGVPVLEMLENALLGEMVTEMFGVLNGTTAFILDAMGEGSTYGDALARAQDAGLAEADPTEDVEGLDTAAKLLLCAEWAWQTSLDPAQVDVTGITAVSDSDISKALVIDAKIVLLARARRDGDSVWLSVKPTVLSRESKTAGALATLAPSGSGLVVASGVNDPVAILGTGAGARPTASAVLRDLVATARDRKTDHSFTTPGPAGAWGTALTVAGPATRETGACVIARCTAGEAENVITQFLEDRGLQVGLTATFDDATVLAVTAPAMRETIAAAMETLESLDGVEVITCLDALM